MIKDKRKKDAPTATETSSNPNSTTENCTTLYRKSQVSKEQRTRNWVFVAYPTKEQLDKLGSGYDGSDGYGTLPDDWRNILEDLHIQWIESPLHDKDKNPNGATKKPHWHVLLMFEGNKSFEQIKAITDALNAPTPQKCNSVKGTVRYMAHLDHPDKYQYEKGLIVGHGGADVAEHLKMTNSTRYQYIKEMRKWVNETGCVEFCDLFDYAAEEHFEDWFPLLCDNSAYIMGEFIKSRRNKNMKKQQTFVRVDNATGEILGIE